MTAPYVSDKNALVIAVLLALSIPVVSQPVATKTADQLSRELSDGSAKVRGRAAADLSRLGYEAIQAVPALSAALKHDDAAVRSGAALTISKIGPEAAAVQGGSQDANLAQEPAPPPPAKVANPMASFARMVSGEWRTTALAGTSTFDTWHWGPGQHSMRVMTDGSGAAGEPWRELQVFYWHPGRKQVYLLGLSPFARGVSDGTIKFEGETADGVFDLYQTGATPRLRKMGLHWAFDGPDKYHDILLEATGPDGLKPMNEWDHIRSKTPTAKRQRTGEEAPKPSGRLKALESLLGHTWNAKGNWGNGDAFHIESTFEWIPLANAIYARSFALRGNGEPTHVLDAYFYHHTGTDRLHCLALLNLGGVYEGDLTVLDGGALQLDLKGYEGERVVPYVVRFDFEKDGTLYHRIWSLAGAERTPMLDVHHTVSEMSKGNKGDLWLGTHEAGAYKFNGKTFEKLLKPKKDQPARSGEVEAPKEALKDNPLDNLARAADAPPGGRIDEPANRDPYFTPIAAKTTSSMPRVIIRNIREDRAGNIWFATFGGPIRFNGKDFTNFSEEVGLAKTRIFSLLEDRSGALWFGSITGGASRYDGKTFTNFTEKEGLGDNDVHWIFEDRNARIWFGTGKGVSRYDGKSMTNFTTKEGLVHNSVYTIAEDASGRIWFGTQGGICSYDGKSFSNLADQVGRSFVNIRAMVVDRSGNLWFGGQEGAFRYDGKTLTTFTTKEGLLDDFVGSMIVDRAGNVWLGHPGRFPDGQGGGASRYDGKSFKQFTQKDGLGSLTVYCMLEDKAGNIWFGSVDAGACRYDGKTFTSFSAITPPSVPAQGRSK
jgi:hypothetical protein